jgi:hypothetical protein
MIIEIITIYALGMISVGGVLVYWRAEPEGVFFGCIFWPLVLIVGLVYKMINW